MLQPTYSFIAGAAAPSDTADAAAFIRETSTTACTVHVYGEVDLANACELEAAIGAPHRIDKRLIVNLSQCGYMDSTGLAVLIRAKKRVGESFGVELGDNPRIHTLFRVAGLDKLFR